MANQIKRLNQVQKDVENDQKTVRNIVAYRLQNGEYAGLNVIIDTIFSGRTSRVYRDRENLLDWANNEFHRV